MGLDMYLNKKIYVGAEYEHRNVTGKIEIFIDGKAVNVNFNKVSEIIERAGYWRKSNQIHKWFVENVQNGTDDCGEYHVEKEKMQELLKICKKIKKSCPLVDGAVANGYRFEGGVKMPIVEIGKEMANYQLAEKLLPTKSGFFFGSTDYNQYYMDDINETIEILESAIKDDSGDFYYQSSW